MISFAAITAWSLSIAGAMVLALPAAVESVPTVRAGQVMRLPSRVYLPGLPPFPIPTDRAAFDEAQRGFRESDEDALDRAYSTGAWFPVTHDEAVLIMAVDGQAAQVEMIDGPHAGRRGWMLRRQLMP